MTPQNDLGIPKDASAESLSESVQAPTEAPQDWVPSQFNARTVAPDGTLVLWNSYTNSFSGFPPETREQVQDLLHPNGVTAPHTGLTKYMVERGFLVRRGVNELGRFRLRYGQRHYRHDLLDVTIMATEDCNFRCVYCYEKFGRGTMEPWVRKALIRMVERRAPMLKTFRASYFGGEPLLGFESVEELAPAFLKMVDQHNLDFASGMTTNAYLLTPDIFARLLQWQINHFQITLDGLPDDHDSRRVLKHGGRTFCRILENLTAMQACKDKFKVTLRVNFDQASAPRMREFVDMMKVFRGDQRFEMLFYPITQLGGGNDRNLNICGDLDPQRDILETLGREMGMRVQRTTATKPFGSPCYANEPNNVIVGVDGALMKCTVLLDSNERNMVGHLREDGSASIDIDRFVAWCAPHFEEDPECRKCFFLAACAGAICPTTRVGKGKRRCPPDKVRINAALNKLWAVNHAKANRYDLRREQLLRFDESQESTTVAGPVASPAL